MTSLKNKIHDTQYAMDRFYGSEKIAKALKLGLCSGWHVLLHGEGGHGKSEMINAFLSQMAGNVRIWKTQMHVESSISSLFGGLDMKELKESGQEKYRVKWSLLTSDIAVLEEMLDSPPAVLAALKATLTEKRLLNGAQNVPLETKLIIAPTNKSPEEIADLGASEAATLERFPIQVEVVTPELQRPETWLEMAERQALEKRILHKEDMLTRNDLVLVRKKVNEVHLSSEFEKLRSQFIVDARKIKALSPRTGLGVGTALIKANAFLDGRDYATEEDLKVYKFLVCEGVEDEKEFDDLFFESVELSKKLEDEKGKLQAYASEIVEIQERKQRPRYECTPENEVKQIRQLKSLVQLLKNMEVLEQHAEWKRKMIEDAERTRDNILHSF